jgi:rhamnosyltransferase subunit B
VSRIVVTTIGSLGDLHPKIAIAIELRKRGHDVVFATHKGYQPKIAALGFEFHEMRPDGTDDPLEIARMTDRKTGSEYCVRHWLLPSLRDTYTDLMSVAKLTMRRTPKFSHVLARSCIKVELERQLKHSDLVVPP